MDYHGGLYVFDKPIEENPTGVVGIGGNGIIVSNEKDSEGHWIVKTAISNKGISGQEIITQSITANKLAADIGQSLDLTSNVAITQMIESIQKKARELAKLEVDLDGLRLWKEAQIDLTDHREGIGTITTKEAEDFNIVKYQAKGGIECRYIEGLYPSEDLFPSEELFMPEKVGMEEIE